MTANLALQSTVDPNLSIDPNEPANGVSSAGGGFCGINSPIEIFDSIFAKNRAVSSGGGLYLGGSDQDLETAPLLHNCLVHGNSAGRSGGGVSINWYDEPIISNCTIAENFASGAFGEAFGGGLYVGYDSNAVMVDSIVWGNSSSQLGSQIAVTNGFPYGPRPSTLRIRHSDIQPDADPSAIAGALDLVLVIDSTESMAESVLALDEAAAQITAAVAAVASDYRVGIVDYKDFNDTTVGAATDYPFRVVAPLTNDLTRVVGGLGSIATPAGSGGDQTTESLYFALMDTIDSNDLDLGEWRASDWPMSSTRPPRIRARGSSASMSARIPRPRPTSAAWPAAPVAPSYGQSCLKTCLWQ
jgi:hypothetical protein